MVSAMHEKDSKLNGPKTAILWGREDVLGIAVEFFLTSRNEWKVIRVSDDEGPEALFSEVERSNPEVVIVYLGYCSNDLRLVVQLIEDHPGTKVINISLENNSVEVYNKQKIWVNELSDLFSIFEI